MRRVGEKLAKTTSCCGQLLCSVHGGSFILEVGLMDRTSDFPCKMVLNEACGVQEVKYDCCNFFLNDVHPAITKHI